MEVVEVDLFRCSSRRSNQLEVLLADPSARCMIVRAGLVALVSEIGETTKQASD